MANHRYAIISTKDGPYFGLLDIHNVTVGVRSLAYASIITQNERVRTEIPLDVLFNSSHDKSYWERYPYAILNISKEIPEVIVNVENIFVVTVFVAEYICGIRKEAK